MAVRSDRRCYTVMSDRRCYTVMSDRRCYTLWFLYLVLICLGLPFTLRVTTAQNLPCACQQYNCATNGLYSTDGRKRNVAYGKSASMSSVYSATGEVAGPACLAVNGRVSTVMVPLNRADSPNCVHSDFNDYQASWQVDLGATYLVESVTVYKRKYQASRMAYINVEVGGSLCYQFSDDTHDIGEKIEANCGQNLTGSTVTLRKRSERHGDDGFINFCEVQVWVCVDGTYGSNCASNCSSCRNNDVCHKESGACPSGCQPGYQPADQTCKLPCARGSYGDNCSNSCGQCRDGDVCNTVTGTCPSGCRPGFDPTDLCKTPCDVGSYGDNCANSCGQCRDGDVCNTVNGTCPSGCRPGFDPTDLCKTPCGDGTYGQNCANSCGQCRDGDVCNTVNGTCPSGCRTGFDPTDLCKTSCGDGTYGQNCANSCGQCRDGDVCNTVTGTCPSGCRPGFDPTDFLCKRSCADGTYGENCVSSCGQCGGNDVCDKTNGSCPAGCKSGYNSTDLLCMTQVAGDGSSTGMIAGAAVGAVVFIVAIIIVLLFFLRYRRKKKAPSASSDNLTTFSSVGFTSHNEESALSFEPVGKMKPTAPVKPAVAAKPGSAGEPSARNTEVQDDASHLYSNVGASGPTPQSRTPQGKDRDKLRPGVRDKPRPMANGDHKEDKESTDPDVLEEGVSLDEDDHVYQNVRAEEVYASFQASQPQMDSVQTHLVQRLASGELAQEFNSLQKEDNEVTREVGTLPDNWQKNRFASILPYDPNRVVLNDGYTGQGSTDYVNASYISGYRRPKQYIASQGPRDNTVWDMWRTVWQDNVTVIVMLTRLEEAGKNKCHQYWPEEEGGEALYGPLTVVTTRVQCRDTFYIRSLTVTKGRETREVTQYHYVSWPDHGAPTVTSLVSFWRHVSRRTKTGKAGPALVHCSAGVGRTGTYIGLDLGMALAVGEGHVDLPGLVQRLRAERVLMVQGVAQYTFLCKALLEAYTARDTVLSVEEFDQVFSKQLSPSSPHPRLHREFQTLNQLQKMTPGLSCDIAIQPDNLDKNRNPRVLPADDHLVYLTEHVPSRNQYINAVYMRTFYQSRGSILTQCPLASTVVDFWRLVYGNDVTTIVSLISPDEEGKEQCGWWPRGGEDGRGLQAGPYTVTVTSTQPHLATSTTLHRLTLQKKGAAAPRSVQLYQYRGWRGEVGGGVGEVLALIDTVLSASTLSPSPTVASPPPLLLQCSDGVTKSGLFSALCDVITRVTYDRQVDVFMTVRHLQTVMPAAVMSLEQYHYCYEVVQARVRESSIYANT